MSKDGKVHPIVMAAFAALLGGFAGFFFDELRAGDERNQQFATVKEILARVEKKVDDNARANSGRFNALDQRVTAGLTSHGDRISGVQTDIAVIKQRIAVLESVSKEHDHAD